MDQVYKVLTCAYTKKTLKCQDLVFNNWTDPKAQVFTFFPKFSFSNGCIGYFQMVKTPILNLVMIRVSGITYVCLTVENMVYYWKDDQYFQMGNNYIYRAQYPALANFVFISWTEGFLNKWLLSTFKPFSSHLVFSSNCDISLGRKNGSDKRILQLCIDLWENDEGSLTNWEMEEIKPWELDVQNISDYKRLESLAIEIFKNKLTMINIDCIDKFYKTFVIDSRPYFVDTPFKLLEVALDNLDSPPDLLNWLSRIWPNEMVSARAREMKRIYS